VTRSPSLPVRPPERVLAIKLADFGDALLTTPALASLRSAWPEARLDVLTTPGPAATVFRHSGLVDQIETLPRPWLAEPGVPLGLARTLRARRYDRVLLFHSLVTSAGALKHAALVLATGAPVRAGLVGPARWRSAFLTHRAADRGYAGWHVVEANLAVAAAAGAPPVTDRLSFQVPAAAEAAAQTLLAELPPGRRVALHPGGGPFSLARRWPPERFAAVADALGAEGHAVLLVGTAADDTAAVRSHLRRPVVDLTDRTDLPTLAAVLRRVDAVVANDGGVAHLAAAMDRPVVAIFGPTGPEAWGPWPPANHRIVRLELPCQPCLYVGHRLGEPRGCATRDCLTWLGPARVLAAVRDILGSAS
jgi:heptosyltransferase-2